GHTQEEVIGYKEVFALVVRIEAIRLFLAYASFMDFMVYKVVKELYGLHQAPRAWCETLADYLLENGFQRGKIDQTLFIKKQKDGKSASTPIDTEKPLLKDLDVKRIFRYLKGKPHLGLWYLKNSPFNLMAYSNSYYVGASLDRKSTTGGCQFLGCRSISWQCKKHTVVATSSTEAEYVAAASCYAQVLWIQNQIITAVSYKLMLVGLTKDDVHLMLLDDLSSHTTKYTSPTLTQKVFANMRGIGKGFSGIETPLFNTMLVQPQVQDAAKVKEDEDDIEEDASKQGGIAELDADEDVTLVDVDTVAEMDADIQGRMEEDATAVKEINAVKPEPTIINDKEVTMTMAQTLIKMKAEKARILDEQIMIKKQENIDWNVVAEQMQEKHLDNIKKYQILKRKPFFVAQARKNMIVYLKNMARYKIQHFKETPTVDPQEMYEEDVKNMLQIVPVVEFKMEALQVKYPFIDWEIYFEGSRTYWRIIRVGGIIQAYRSFEDMVKDFDKEDLDALWRLTNEKFSIAMLTEDKEKALWVELKRLYEPNAADVF
nr:uncharacterized mitochondrial protein AtMg00810-like [Tanacetum cinerariifolium]